MERRLFMVIVVVCLAIPLVTGLGLWLSGPEAASEGFCADDEWLVTIWVIDREAYERACHVSAGRPVWMTLDDGVAVNIRITERVKLAQVMVWTRETRAGIPIGEPDGSTDGVLDVGAR